METKHELIFGDCLEELKKIQENSIDLVFADPPYNMSKSTGLGWKYSKHITMQEAWDIFSNDKFFQFNTQKREMSGGKMKNNKKFVFVFDFLDKGNVHIFNVSKNMDTEKIETYLSKKFNLSNIEWVAKENKTIFDHT